MEHPVPASVHRVVAEGGVSLAVHQVGEGPALLLIPGLGTDHHVFHLNVPELASRFRCLVLDQRGMGLSQASPGTYTMELLADDAARVVEALAGPPARVLGASMGGMVAQHLAIRHPGAVSQLVLGCTGPGGRLAVRAAPGVTRQLLGADAKDPAGAYREACRVLYEPAWAASHPEVIEDAVSWRSRHPVRPAAFRAQWDAVRHHDAGPALAGIACPTLILHGSADVVMPPENAERLAELIPGARLEWLPGRGHLFFQEAPERTLELVSGFLLPAST